MQLLRSCLNENLSKISQIPGLAGCDMIFAATTVILPGLNLLFGRWYIRKKIKSILPSIIMRQVDVCVSSSCINEPVFRTESNKLIPKSVAKGILRKLDFLFHRDFTCYCLYTCRSIVGLVEQFPLYTCRSIVEHLTAAAATSWNLRTWPLLPHLPRQGARPHFSVTSRDSQWATPHLFCLRPLLLASCWCCWPLLLVPLALATASCLLLAAG
jgi:hypothetical protein